jgi:hypothetical protein
MGVTSLGNQDGGGGVPNQTQQPVPPTPASTPSVQSPYSTIIGMGNSYGTGQGATALHGHFAKIAAALGVPPAAFLNLSVSGSYVDGDNNAPAANGFATILQDIPATSGAAPYLANGQGTLYLIQFGLNEAAYFGATPNAINQFKSALRAVVSRARAGSTGVFEETHASVTLGGAGAWTEIGARTNNSGAGVTYTATNGNTVTITVPADFPGGTIALGVLAQAAGAGVHTVTVDGVAAGTVDTRTLAGTVAGKGAPNINAAILRINGLSPGAHTIVDTVSLITALAYFDYWQIESPSPPTVILFTHPRCTPAGYAVYTAGGFAFTPTDSMVQAYCAATHQLALEFDSNVMVVDSDQLFQANPAYFNAGFLPHPNDAGYSLLAAAGLQAIQSRGLWLPSLAGQA